MNVLVVYAHPYDKSFNHAILEQVEGGLREAGHTVEVVDLYAINFDPVLSARDLVMLQEGKVADDVREQQEKLTWADGLIIIHPIWWENHPAILKGWIDRVFSHGFAYTIDDQGAHGLLDLKRVLLIMTAGGTEEEAIVDGVDICKRIFYDQRALEFCGVRGYTHEVFYNVLMGDDQTRQDYLNKAYDLARNF